MASKQADYQKALDRARARANEGVKTSKSFAGTSRNAVRSLDLNVISKGDKVFFPADYDVIEETFGSNTAVRVLTADGRDFWVSVLTRGAKPLSGGDYVRPKGTAVEACQNYATNDEFFKEELIKKGQGIEFTDYETVITRGYGNEESREAKVWTLNLVPDPEAQS